MMKLDKILYCATVLIFGCTMLSSACKLSISSDKGKLVNNERLEKTILKTANTLETILNRTEKMLKQRLKNLCKGNMRLEDVSYKKMTGQSSEMIGRFPSRNAVDGDLSTMFLTQFDKKPYWWVDLGSSFSVQHVELWNRGNGAGTRLRKLDIMVGPTLSKMKLCTHYKGPAKDGEHLILKCSEPTNGRYVKLALGVQEWFHLMEVKVFAYSKTC